MKTITKQGKYVTEVGQTLWILLNNQKKKIKVGVIYPSKESVTLNKELKKIVHINNIRNHKSKEKDQQSITGDFNAKIGNRKHVSSNKRRKKINKNDC